MLLNNLGPFDQIIDFDAVDLDIEDWGKIVLVEMNIGYVVGRVCFC